MIFEATSWPDAFMVVGVAFAVVIGLYFLVRYK